MSVVTKFVFFITSAWASEAEYKPKNIDTLVPIVKIDLKHTYTPRKNKFTKTAGIKIICKMLLS
jgi:hypothetical protein